MVLVACLGALFPAHTPASAAEPIVFNGIVNGTIPADMGPPVAGSDGCVFNFFVTNAGSATELGNSLAPK